VQEEEEEGIGEEGDGLREEEELGDVRGERRESVSFFMIIIIYWVASMLPNGFP
jgi:hypothetical protein